MVQQWVVTQKNKPLGAVTLLRRVWSRGSFRRLGVLVRMAG